MWSKETSILGDMCKRWDPGDLPELTYRMLYRERDEDGDPLAFHPATWEVR